MVRLLPSCLLLVSAVSVAADLVTLYKIDGEDCVQVTVEQGNVEYVKSFATPGLRVGACSDKNFDVEVPSGNTALHIPLVTEPLIFKRMQMSAWEAAKLKAEAFFTTHFLRSPVSFLGGSRHSSQLPPIRSQLAPRLASRGAREAPAMTVRRKRAGNRIRGVPRNQWSFDVKFKLNPDYLLSRNKDHHDQRPDAEIVAYDKKGEVGWLELYYKAADDGRNLAVPSRIEDEERSRAFGTNLYVESDVRRLGVATALIEAAECVVGEWQLSELVMTSVRDSPSHHLLMGLGFQEANHKFGEGSKAVLLRKVLTALPEVCNAEATIREKV